MATEGGPNIITDGLVLVLDAANVKSYPGTGTTWYDKSGNRFNGTLANGPTYSTSGGGSIVLDGSNDYIQIADNGITSGFNQQSFTINMWIKLTRDGTYEVVWSYDFTSHNPPYYAQHIRSNNSQGTLTMTINGDGAYFGGNVSVTGWTFGQWFNATFTRDFTTGANKSYKNGVLQESNTLLGTILYYNQPVWIGKSNFSTGYMKGNAGQYSFYNRALTSSEVLQNYNATK